MSLDMFQDDREAALANASRRMAPDLPATFGETFPVAWNDGVLFGSSMNRTAASMTAVEDYIDRIRDRTGTRLVSPLMDGGPTLDEFNGQVGQLAEKHPDLNLKPLSREDIDQMAVERSRGAREELKAMQAREKTWGGTAGSLLGSVASTATDPVNIATLPLAAPKAAGIVMSALSWGGIAGGTQTAIEALGGGFREEVEPGYAASGQPVRNVLEAAVGGAVIGGGIKAAANAWTRVKTGEWPRSVRDAGNVVDSEANIANTNPLPGVEGEVAHREALSKAIDDIVAGRPVDVESIVPRDLAAAAEARLEPIHEARAAAVEAEAAAKAERAAATETPTPELPFQQTAREAEAAQHFDTVTEGVQNLARMSGHEMPLDEAKALAQRVVKAPDDDAAAILNEAFLRPRTITEGLPSVSAAAAERRAAEKAAADVQPASPELSQEMTPRRVEDVRTDPEIADATLRDLDRLRAERGDIEIPMGVAETPEGQRVPVMRKVEEIVAEAEAREDAAREILACVGPQPEPEVRS